MHEDDKNGKVIVKVNKIEHICPLDRLEKINQVKTTINQDEYDENKLKIFEKYKYQMIETGDIPE